MELTIRRPDDWHLHLRDDAMLAMAIHPTIAKFGRALVMPNLVPPLTNRAMVKAYEERIDNAVGALADMFEPLMTCYLTDVTDLEDLKRGHEEGLYFAAKLYPANATTNSAQGVTSLDAIERVLACMEQISMPLLVHGEVTDPAVDIFDREAVFIERVLTPLLQRHPDLRVVMEHITTRDAVEFVRAAGENVAATITPHHLMLNRNDLLVGGIKPHLYCLPIVKSEEHRRALRKVATSGEARFFLGTDSAPHPLAAKECACGCAGIFNAPVALEACATVFAEEGALNHLEAFVSLNGADFYNQVPNDSRITLTDTPWRMADSIPLAGEGRCVRPFLAGETIPWKVANPAG